MKVYIAVIAVLKNGLFFSGWLKIQRVWRQGVLGALACGGHRGNMGADMVEENGDMHNSAVLRTEKQKKRVQMKDSSTIKTPHFCQRMILHWTK